MSVTVAARPRQMPKLTTERGDVDNVIVVRAPSRSSPFSRNEASRCAFHGQGGRCRQRNLVSNLGVATKKIG